MFILPANVSYNSSDNCSTPHYVASWHEFFSCYGELASEKLTIAVLELMLVFSSLILNLLTIGLIYFCSISYNMFDQILIGICIIQTLTSIVDIPFYHIQSLFGYWPLPKWYSYLWASYDNNINTNTNMHTLYMCWARLRSIQEPVKYKEELLFKYPKILMGCMWVVSLGIWTPITVVFNNLPYSATLNYEPAYLQNIFNFVFWFLPLIGILVISCKIIILLNLRTLRRMKISAFSTKKANKLTASSGSQSENKSKFNWRGLFKRHETRPEVKFMLIIFIYWLQWTIPCIVVLINGFCQFGCVPSHIFIPIYWLTYTVVLTDPLTVILLNPNIKLSRSRP